MSDETVPPCSAVRNELQQYHKAINFALSTTGREVRNGPLLGKSLPIKTAVDDVLRHEVSLSRVVSSLKSHQRIHSDIIQIQETTCQRRSEIMNLISTMYANEKKLSLLVRRARSHLVEALSATNTTSGSDGVNQVLAYARKISFTTSAPHPSTGWEPSQDSFPRRPPAPTEGDMRLCLSHAASLEWSQLQQKLELKAEAAAQLEAQEIAEKKKIQDAEETKKNTEETEKNTEETEGSLSQTENTETIVFPSTILEGESSAATIEGGDLEDNLLDVDSPGHIFLQRTSDTLDTNALSDAGTDILLGKPTSISTQENNSKHKESEQNSQVRNAPAVASKRKGRQKYRSQNSRPKINLDLFDDSSGDDSDLSDDSDDD